MALQRLDRGLHRPEPLRRDRDRLTIGGDIIETGTDSYRLAGRRAHIDSVERR